MELTEVSSLSLIHISVRGSAGAGSCQGAQSQNAQAHSGGRDSGKGAARGTDDGTVCTGGLPDTEAAAARLNPSEGLRETGGLPFFLPKGALTHHCLEGAAVLRTVRLSKQRYRQQPQRTQQQNASNQLRRCGGSSSA